MFERGLERNNIKFSSKRRGTTTVYTRYTRSENIIRIKRALSAQSNIDILYRRHNISERAFDLSKNARGQRSIYISKTFETSSSAYNRPVTFDENTPHITTLCRRPNYIQGAQWEKLHFQLAKKIQPLSNEDRPS